MTVIPNREYFKLKEGIKEIDEKAFFIVTDSYQVYGGEQNFTFRIDCAIISPAKKEGLLWKKYQNYL